jgi:urea transport system substrate-binding protein
MTRFRLWLALLALAVVSGAAYLTRDYWQTRAPIKVGILHSLTGPMAISEKPMVDAALMAIDEINAAGGLLGRRVEPLVVDGASDWPTFAREAERLIKEDKVVTIFGCWTSACRKTVRPVFERLDHLLVYAMAYEGLENSPNIIYTGAAPNQQVLPALQWALSGLGTKVFLIGSDYVWPHAINAIMKDQLAIQGATLLGESYVPFGATDLTAAVAAIRAAQPDVVFSSVVGESNPAFYAALRAAGLTPERLPVVSFSIGESELEVMKAADVAGHFVAWNYFQSLPGDVNADFIRRFRARYGAERPTSDVTEAAWFSVKLWAQAVEEAGGVEPDRIRSAMLRQSVEAPEGVVSVDPDTQHTWRPVSIGRVQPSGQIEVVWSASRPIRPVPYPKTRTPAQWEAFLADLHAQWGGQWANPRTP